MSDEAANATERLARRHLRFGWSAVLVFAVLGLTLETLHGFKVRAYLDVSSESRRLMWTLAHAHGTLLGIVNVVYGLTLTAFTDRSPRTIESRGLMAAAVLLPAGFFLGGVNPYRGDPGLGILLVPVGALLLITGLAHLVLSTRRAGPPASGGRRAKR